MLVIDFIAALAIAALFTIVFCGMVAPKRFRWREASLSTLLLVFCSWMAAVGVVALVPLLSRRHVILIDVITGLAVFAVLALTGSRRIRHAIGLMFEPAQTATRFSVFLYFSIILSLLVSAVVTRYALARLF